MAADDRVDWIDNEGRLLAIVSRARMRAENLLHRSVAVVVRAASPTTNHPIGAVLVHRRAEWKDVWPGAWDVAFGGVVAAGETAGDAAKRELAEEAGVEGADLALLGTFRFTDESVTTLAEVYETFTDVPLQFRDGEVVEVQWVPVADLAQWSAERFVCPDSRAGVLPLIRFAFKGATPG